MIIKTLIHQKDKATYLCTQPWNTQIYKAKTKRIKRRNKQTIIVGDFNTTLSIMDRSSREPILKIENLNNATEQTDLINIYPTIYGNILPNNSRIYISSSSTHGISSRTDHMLSPKISLRKFKKSKIIPGIFPDHKFI